MKNILPKLNLISAYALLISVVVFSVVAIKNFLLNINESLFPFIQLGLYGFGFFTFMIITGLLGLGRKYTFRPLFRLNSWWIAFIAFLVGCFYLTFAIAFTQGRQSVNCPTPSPIPSPTLSPTSVTKPKIIQPGANSSNNNDPWGVAKQIDSVTWTMKVGKDDRMTTAGELFDALNVYRNKYGIHSLQWDDKLAAYAQSRAEYFASIKSTDKHAGFIEFTNDYENLKNLGAFTLGENSSYGYQLSGVHIIEWVYAGDAPHDNNQKSSTYST